jgi:hypothetical protein
VTPASVFFYISGHGFGHAVRQIAIIRALLEIAPGRVRVVVRTSAPAWLFARTLGGAVTLLPGDTDPGAVQIDGLRLDEHATVRAATAFYRTLPARVGAEADILRAHGAALVVADAPPLACAAAAAASVPAVVCSNFTWDWIYQPYIADDPSGAPLLPVMQEAYSSAAGWRLPMHGGFDTVAPIIDVPLVARHARPGRTVDELRRALELPTGVPLALVSFGGYGARDLPLGRLDCLADWRVVITVPQPDGAEAPRGVEILAEELMYARGLQYEDLVHAVDVVVTKPGYGIVSDCAANDTAVLYTSRGRFAEYDVLVREMPLWVRSMFLPRRDLLEGRWKAALDALMAMPPVQEPPPTDGAAVVADLIVARLGLT